mmetsp:Transcript_43941/g.81710  ORF Transcript_43941/g.81710 Transcript_43941/m.81710 type:complete len:174 (-) Transcript_43941:59-580(-)
MAKEVPKSRFDVDLFRRYPDEEGKEKDYGPGYLKLYVVGSDKTGREKKEENDCTKGVQVVFRSHGTKKVRAAHIFNSGEKTQKHEGEDSERAPNPDFDTSFEKELRYYATDDTADMISQTSNCYGKEQVTSPVEFPLSFQFDNDDNRDKFVTLLREQIKSQGEHSVMCAKTVT